MRKKRISQQQSHRIRQKQIRYQAQRHDTLTEGLIIQRFSRMALVEEPSGLVTQCAIRPDIPSLVAGDKVILQKEGDTQGIVVSVLPRQSVLHREDTRGVQKPVAANITQLMIVIAPLPDISWLLLDSYLIMAEDLGLQACIILNKTDLPCDTAKKCLETTYQAIGYPTIRLSKTSLALDTALLDALRGQTSVFVGQSGVGKSTIIARILPTPHAIQTSALSEQSQLGQHTTSNSCLYHLPGGGHLIDSPGMREFRLNTFTPHHIAQGFREFRPYIERCQFRNCNHYETPGCAVMQALENHSLQKTRYDNYLKLIAKFSEPE